MPARGRWRGFFSSHAKEGQAPAAKRGAWPLSDLRYDGCLSRVLMPARRIAAPAASSPATPAGRRARRHLGCPLPGRSVVELDGHPIRGIDRAHICPGDPDAARVVHPAAGGLAGLVDQVEFPSILRSRVEVTSFFAVS